MGENPRGEEEDVGGFSGQLFPTAVAVRHLGGKLIVVMREPKSEISALAHVSLFAQPTLVKRETDPSLLEEIELIRIVVVFFPTPQCHSTLVTLTLKNPEITKTCHHTSIDKDEYIKIFQLVFYEINLVGLLSGSHQLAHQNSRQRR